MVGAENALGSTLGRDTGYKATADDWVSHCRRGHKRTEQNTKTIQRTRNGKPSTEKVCLECHRDALRRYDERKAARDGMSEV